MINKLELQALLFEKDTCRTELLSYVSTIEPSHRVAIYRNHSFELVENTIKPYLDYGGLNIDFLYSSYDDSLSFIELDTSVDAVVLWLDLSLYEMSNLSVFILERVKYLREIFDRNVLFIPCSTDISFDTSDFKIEQYSLTPIQDALGDQFFDLRMESFSGTKLSSKAILEVSRDLGLNYLPGLLKPNLKGVVVDLDNTLYRGVLGEDGVDGVELTDGHRELQVKLKELSQQGFFLSISSKNDEGDVLRLLDERKDFPLKSEDFVNIYANWESKADSIASIAASLNIASDSLVFIDDNLGELVSVLEKHPTINVIWAKDDALLTFNVLSNFPGLLKLESKKEDSLRKGDVLANKKRLEIQNSLSLESYIKELNMELLFEIDKLDVMARVSELSNKTNQFIFSYQRYNAQQIKNLMDDDDSVVVAISLADRLSESGIIGVVVLRQCEDLALLEECFVSCRALGRGIDQAIVLGGVSVAMQRLELNRLKINFSKGERNAPAEKFVKQHFASHLKSDGVFEYQIPTDIIAVTIN